jgi:hypothetical protein
MIEPHYQFGTHRLVDPGNNGYYPVAYLEVVPHNIGTHETVRAIATGEFRQPRLGEWYLAGSPVEAYRVRTVVPTRSYHIATLVKGSVITTWVPDDNS